METIIIEVKSKKQSNVLKEIAKAFDADFRIVDGKENPYHPEFVEKIRQGERDKQEGNYVSYSLKELENLCK